MAPSTPPGRVPDHGSTPPLLPPSHVLPIDSNVCQPPVLLNISAIRPYLVSLTSLRLVSLPSPQSPSGVDGLAIVYVLPLVLPPLRPVRYADTLAGIWNDGSPHLSPYLLSIYSLLAVAGRPSDSGSPSYIYAHGVESSSTVPGVSAAWPSSMTSHACSQYLFVSALSSDAYVRACSTGQTNGNRWRVVYMRAKGEHKMTRHRPGVSSTTLWTYRAAGRLGEKEQRRKERQDGEGYTTSRGALRAANITERRARLGAGSTVDTTCGTAQPYETKERYRKG
ncbi:hypothetical protein C8Q77DRAFT_806553 [Trametes polyzona]|nr:hypothetical protein C8Q77DRAFT_806553 [Trametes polyzona]